MPKEIFRIINESGETIQVDMSTPNALCPSPMVLQPHETYSVLEYPEPIIVVVRGAYIAKEALGMKEEKE